MKTRIVTGLASLTLFDIAAAQAQTPLPNWTGFYLGAHVGGRFVNADVTSTSYTLPGFGGIAAQIPGYNSSDNFSSGIGGAHLGYNWQIDPAWLLGFEGDWSWGRNKATFSKATSGFLNAADFFIFRQQSELTLQWQSTIRARAGFIAQSALWYVTGGVAFAHVKWTDTATHVFQDGGGAPTTLSNSSRASKTLTGWVVGAGFEQMLSPNFTWRIEYLFESFDGFNVPEGIGPRTGTVDLDAVQKVRIGFTWKQ